MGEAGGISHESAIEQIEKDLRKALKEVGVLDSAVRTQEIGDYWRKQGQDFLISKQFDITLTDFKQIDEIIKHIDTKGINTMRIGELEIKICWHITKKEKQKH